MSLDLPVFETALHSELEDHYRPFSTKELQNMSLIEPNPARRRKATKNENTAAETDAIMQGDLSETEEPIANTKRRAGKGKGQYFIRSDRKEYSVEIGNLISCRETQNG